MFNKKKEVEKANNTGKFILTYRRFKAASFVSLFIAGLTTLLVNLNLIDIIKLDLSGFAPTYINGFSQNLLNSINAFLFNGVFVFIGYFVPALLITYRITKYFYPDLQEDKEVHKRGAKKDSPEAVKKLIEEDLKQSEDEDDFIEFYVGQQQIPITYKQASKNIAITGEVGSGKTICYYDILEGNFIKDKLGNSKKANPGLLEKTNTAIFYESKGGDYNHTFYDRTNPNHYLFDLRDEQFLGWNIVEDILDKNGRPDLKAIKFIVKSIISPDPKNMHFIEQSYGVAVPFFVMLAGMPKANNKITIDLILALEKDGTVLRNVLMNNETVKEYQLQGGVANALTVDANGALDRQGASVMATINKMFRGLNQLEFYHTRNDFSVKKFLSKVDTVNQRLFIVNPKEESGSAATYSLLLFSLILRYGLSIGQSKTRRITCSIDELPTLASDGNEAGAKHLLIEMIQFIGVSRSFGYSWIFGFQGMSQIEHIVGKVLMESFFQLIGTKIIFKYSEPKGQRFLADFVGKKEIERIRSSYTQSGRSLDPTSAKAQESEEEKLKDVVLPNEFNMSPPLHAFISIGSVPVTQFNLIYHTPPKITNDIPALKENVYDHSTIDKMSRFYAKKSKEIEIRRRIQIKKDESELKAMIENEMAKSIK